MAERARVAVIDDEPRMAEILAMVLRRDGHEALVFGSGERALEAHGDEPFDLVVTDLRMEAMDGLGVLAEVRRRTPDVPVILVTAYASVQTAVAALRDGAFDYLQKPFDNDRCRASVRRALELTRLTRENRYLRAALSGGDGVPTDAIAASAEMREVFSLARRAARSSATVLITGESGTGKEVVARAVHYHSPRVGAPFVALNVKALAGSVLESELFGHEKGAFTGASAARIGVFRRASGGTLFLDEIGELDIDAQAKLLRALQEGEVLPVGSARAVTVDVRVIAATNRDLTAEVAGGRFREDLYYRLNVIPVHIPPLRERRADVVPLARHFLARYATANERAITGWSEEVESFLRSYGWPGNVREVQNAMERAVVLARGESIELDDLLLPRPRSSAAGAEPETSLSSPRLHDAMDAAAARAIRAALDVHDGRRVEAARALGVERTTLYRLMKRLGIEG